MINYNKERNEILIHGCGDCPFMESEYPLGFCHLLKAFPNIAIDLWKIPNEFPENCPLNDPNFKFTRVKE